MKTEGTYLPPLDITLVSFIVGETSSGSHEGAYKGSIDFAVPLGTTVLAAANGKVTRVRDDSDRHGEDASFGHEANYISIKHENDEISEYLHLAKESAQVKVGDTVRAGDVIATTGLSGWLFAPHLHFMVYADDTDLQCRQVRFTPPLPPQLLAS
jgi:murein DD-endopeptidase MepM/ murein hydrolase activator NlpD